MQGYTEVVGNVGVRRVLEICLEKNERRFTMPDSRPLRPRFVSAAVQTVVRFLARPERGRAGFSERVDMGNPNR